MRTVYMIIAVGLVGCATPPKPTDSARMPRYDIAKKLVAGIVPTSIRMSNPSTVCPRTVEAKGPIARLVKTVNACVRAKAWNKVDKIGQVLARNNPESPLGAYYLGLVADHQNDLGRALWMVDLALKKAPSVGLFHYEKGRLLYKQKKYHASVDEFQSALNLDSRLYPAHGFLGAMYLREERVGAATEQFQELRKAQPNSAIAIAGLKKCGVKVAEVGPAKPTKNRAVASKGDLK